MMRRYYWTSDGNRSVVIDYKEFFECNSAKTYYLLALKYAKTEKFKALCLRMIGRCEKNKLDYLADENYSDNYADYQNYLFGKNKYYQDLKANYSKHYEELTSDCNAFEEYFNARR
jgi:hypothetical protein